MSCRDSAELLQFWEAICSSHGFLNEALDSEVELISLFVPMIRGQYGSGNQKLIAVLNVSRSGHSNRLSKVLEGLSNLVSTSIRHFARKVHGP